MAAAASGWHAEHHQAGHQARCAQCLRECWGWGSADICQQQLFCSVLCNADEIVVDTPSYVPHATLSAALASSQPFLAQVASPPPPVVHPPPNWPCKAAWNASARPRPCHFCCLQEMSLEDFIFSHPAQVALLGIQFQWTADTQVRAPEAQLSQGADSGLLACLNEALAAFCLPSMLMPTALKPLSRACRPRPRPP